MFDDPSHPTIRPWLAEFGSPAREHAFRAHETGAAQRGFLLAALVIALGDLASAWFDWERFSARAPDRVWRLLAVRVLVLVAAALLGAGALRWRRARPMAFTLLGVCLAVSLMQAVASYECTVTLGQPDNPFWFGFFAFLALTVFPVPLRLGLGYAGIICATELVLHALVFSARFDDLTQVVTQCVLATGMGAALANRLNRGRRREHVLLASQWRLNRQLQGQVEERSEAAARLLEDKSELELRLAQAQRLEALGRLAGGVAHDLNNLMTPVVMCAELAQRELERRGDPLAATVREITIAAERTRDLVKRLLAFGRRQALETTVFDLGELVQRHESMLKRLVNDRVRVRFESDPGPAVVEADPAQIGQVLLNLGTNAADAMPEGGELVVHVRREEVTGDSSDLPSGRYVVLLVKDTGRGMDQNTQDRMFEPFFTTKAQGHSGLGLATVHGVVRQHGGSIRVRSRSGEGTAFTVYLRESSVPLRASGGATPGAWSVGGRTESVLLVEDDDEVRRLTELLLRDAGFRVLSARSGAEGLELGRSHQGPLHLVVTDVVMPGMSGAEMWGKLRDERPEAKVLFLSGYAEATLDASDTRVGFLQKPFTLRELEHHLHELLDPCPP
jgi:signal transduction histidine kinase